MNAFLKCQFKSFGHNPQVGKHRMTILMLQEMEIFNFVLKWRKYIYFFFTNLRNLYSDISFIGLITKR